MIKIRRIITFVSLFLLAFIVVAVNSTPNVYAVNTEMNGYTAEENYEYDKLRRFFSYTETIQKVTKDIDTFTASMNGLKKDDPEKFASEIKELSHEIDRLNTKLNDMKEDDSDTYKQAEKYVKKLSPEHKFVKELKKFKNWVEVVDSLGDALCDLIKNGSNADLIADAYSVIKSAAKLIATCFGPAAALVTTSIISVVDKFATLGETSESELQQLERELMDRFDELDFHLDEVQRDIYELSKSVSASTKEIMNELSNAVEASFAKQQVNDFLSSKNGNFDYSLFKDYLFAVGDINSPDYSRNAYVYKVLDLELKDAPEGQLKDAYDNLYKALNVSQVRLEKTPVEKLYEYILKGDSGLESIGIYYYEFIKANNKNKDVIPSVEALDFEEDLYRTALAADNYILLCNYYQLTHLEENEYGEYIYRFGDAKDEFITYDEIKGISKQIEARQELLEAQMLEDITKILNIENSYSIATSDSVFTVNNGNDNYGIVQRGNRVYLNQYAPYVFNDMFGLDDSLIEYDFFQNGQKISSDGSYLVEYPENTKFTGVVSYEGTTLYSIDFVVGNDWFAGGNGTKEDPYLISNAIQFNLINRIEDGNKKNYKLICNIDCEGYTVYRIGSKLYPFEGTFDGNGYSIKNAKLTGMEDAGLFNYVSEKGSVLNLKLEHSKITVESNEKPKAMVGSLVATNYGLIQNCIVENQTVDMHGGTHTPNTVINVYCGGIAGINYGNIINCYVDNTTLNSESKRSYQTNSDSSNPQYMYVGGIAGASFSGIITNCYVGKDVNINAFVESKMFDNLSLRHPVVSIYSCDVIGYASNTNISNVYSEMPQDNNVTTVDAYNESPVGFVMWNNINTFKNIYVGGLSAEENERLSLISAKEDSYHQTDVIFDGKLNYLFDSDLSDEFEGYYANQIYKYGDKSFNYDDLIITVDGEETKYYVIGTYGYSPYYVSYNEANNVREYKEAYNTVTLLVSLINYGVVKEVQIPIITRKVEPVELEVASMPIKKTYEYFPGEYNISKEGAIFYLRYEDGYALDVTNDVVFAKTTLDSSVTNEVNSVEVSDSGIVLTPAKMRVNISYDSFEAYFEVYVTCNHKWVNEHVDNHCNHLGYDVHRCSICGLEYRDNYTDSRLPHDTVIYSINDLEASLIEGYEGYYDSTCKELGYSGDLYCIRCHKIVEKGHVIELKDHVYDHEHCNGNSHLCVNCGNPETHYFHTVEFDDHIEAYCEYCGKTKTYSANSREKIEALPRIIVSDAYAVPSTEEVVVYVELHGNVGVNSVYFSVHYPEELVLKTYSLGNILNKADVTEWKSYSDHLNVTLANKDTDTSKRGTLLKLTFELPKNKVVDQEYVITVSGQKLTDDKVAEVEFLTLDGVITIVDRLPGDVNGDDIVDILDATLIAKYNVTDDKIDFINSIINVYEDFDISYGDVSLDGLEDGVDIVQILRYIVGGYDARIRSNRYRIILDYNNEDIDNGFIMVEYNNGLGVYGDDLPDVSIDGYKFEGWYTDRTYKTKVTSTTKLIINRDQIKQTLYAKYSVNEVTFDGNGGKTSVARNVVNVSDYPNGDVEGNYITLDNNGYSMTTTTTFMYGGLTGEVKKFTLNHKFLGWATAEDGTVDDSLLPYFKLNENGLIYAVDLVTGGYNAIGGLKLYAIWEKCEIEPLAIPDNFGYTFDYWKDNLDNQWNNENNLVVDSSITYKAEWKAVALIVKFEGNGGSVDGLLSYKQYNYYVGSNLNPNNFIRKNYAFLGWSLTFEDATEDNKNLIANGGKMPLNATIVNGEITLYAVWVNYQYGLVYNAQIPNGANVISFYSNGKYENRQAANLIKDSVGQNLISTGYIYSLDEEYNILEDTYVIVGWNLIGFRDNLTNKIYKPGEAFTNLLSATEPEQSITLYALWELNPLEVGANVNTGTTVSSSDGSNQYVVYNTIYSMPWSIESNTIFDWRGETQTNVKDWERPIPEDQPGRYSNFDILNTTESIYFVGKTNQEFKEFTMHFVNCVDPNHTITFHFSNFNITTSDNSVLSQWRSDGQHSAEGPNVVIDIIGECRFNSDKSGGSIFGEKNKEINHLNIQGTGTFTIKGGNGSSATNVGESGQDGGVAIYAKELNIDAKGLDLTIVGGSGGNGVAGKRGSDGTSNDRNDGGTGGNGTSGGNGGFGAAAVVTTSLTITSPATFRSGNGGTGGNGGRGGNGGSWYNMFTSGAGVGPGGNGGKGGDGGMVYPPIVASSLIGTDNIAAIYGAFGKAGTPGAGGDGGHFTSTFAGEEWGDKGATGDAGFEVRAKTVNNNHTYIVFSGKITWEQANSKAIAMGGYLVTISNSSENSIVDGILTSSGLSSAWIGLNDAAVEGTWRWVTGEQYSYSNWYSGQPDNYNNEDYIQMLKGGLWNDLPSSYNDYGFIVEFDFVMNTYN